jgi:hypothetical protein
LLLLALSHHLPSDASLLPDRLHIRHSHLWSGLWRNLLSSSLFYLFSDSRLLPLRPGSRRRCLLLKDLRSLHQRLQAARDLRIQHLSLT